MIQLMELIEEAVSGSGRMCFLPSGEELTFTEVWKRSEAAARWISCRAGRGGAVGAVLSNTSPCAASIFGIWRSGNTLVSLPHPARGMTAQRYARQLLQMTELTGVELVLIDAQYRVLLPDLADLADVADLAGLPRRPGQHGQHGPSVKLATFTESLAGGPRCDTTGSGQLIQFTSGSVGAPKGVALSPEAIAANILSLVEVLEPAPGDVPCSWLPLSHDMGFIGMFLTPIACLAPGILGSGVFVLLTPELFLSQPASWLQACSRLGVTITTAPNFALELACRTRDWAGAVDLSRIRALITGAERVSGATLRRFAGAYAETGFDSRAFCPAYGMAEATLAVTIVRPDQAWRSVRLDREALSEGQQVPATGERGVEYVSNGPAVPGTEVRVVAAADGAVGEVQVRGPSLLSDYAGADLVLTHDGWFPTRDIGFMSGTELFPVGRTDDTVIVGGRNYYAPDIEAALHHDAVRKGCVAAIPLEQGGYGLVAEVRAEVDAGELERVCRELAINATQGVGIRPSMVAIVPRGLLPKTPSGKLQRVRIAERIDSGDIELAALVSLGG
jgi:acyl-CoA synthetase (AMP-forming)/AMP-acid ligase II